MRRTERNLASHDYGDDGLGPLYTAREAPYRHGRTAGSGSGAVPVEA